MPFKEEGSVAYTMINGKKVPVVKCETEVVLRNTRTNQEYNSDQEAENDISDTNTEYNSDAEAEADIANPETSTERSHVVRSVKIKVAAMPPLGASSSDL